MSQQTDSHATPASGPPMDAKPLGRHWKVSGVVYAWVALCLALVVGLGMYYNYFTSSRYPGTDNPIGQQYGVEVISFDRDTEPERITVKEPGKEAVTCLLPTAKELENREPLRGCIPQPPPGTTIPAKQASTK